MVRQTKHPSENDKLRAREQQLKAAKKKKAAKGWKPGEVALLTQMLFPVGSS